MSRLILFTDNASAILASGITATQTSIVLQSGQGAQFPSPAVGQYFIGTMNDALGNNEIFACTSRSSDTLTIVRAIETAYGNTGGGAFIGGVVDGAAGTGYAFSSGARVELRVTAGMLSTLLQKTGSDTMTGTTNLSGILQLGGSGSIQGGEYVGPVRQAAGNTSGQIFVSSGLPYSGSSAIAANQLLTNGTIAGALPASYALLYTGMIIMWSGNTGNIPSGFLICDGNNGTPNLTDRFMVSYTENSTLFAAGANTGTENSGSTTPGNVSSLGYTLTLADLPSHKHPFDYSSSASSVYIGDPGFTLPSNSPASSVVSGSRMSYAGGVNTGAGSNSHTHSVPGSAHTHTISLPYYGMIFIMKT